MQREGEEEVNRAAESVPPIRNECSPLRSQQIPDFSEVVKNQFCSSASRKIAKTGQDAKSFIVQIILNKFRRYIIITFTILLLFFGVQQSV